MMGIYLTALERTDTVARYIDQTQEKERCIHVVSARFDRVATSFLSIRFLFCQLLPLSEDRPSLNALTMRTKLEHPPRRSYSLSFSGRRSWSLEHPPRLPPLSPYPPPPLNILRCASFKVLSLSLSPSLLAHSHTFKKGREYNTLYY